MAAAFLVEAFLVVFFFAVFLAAFLGEAFLVAVFLVAAFFTVFLAAFLGEAFFAAAFFLTVFFAAFLGAAFLVVAFLAVFFGAAFFLVAIVPWAPQEFDARVGSREVFRGITKVLSNLHRQLCQSQGQRQWALTSISIRPNAWQIRSGELRPGRLTPIRLGILAGISSRRFSSFANVVASQKTA